LWLLAFTVFWLGVFVGAGIYSVLAGCVCGCWHIHCSGCLCLWVLAY